MTIADPNQLPAPARRDRIRDLLEERGFVRVTEISEAFGVSRVTARTDLDTLVERGDAVRVHGGAMPVGTRAAPESSLEVAVIRSAIPKQRIAEVAAALVRSGQSVILDVGSTGLAVARALKARRELTDVVIITNGLTIALELESEVPRFTVIVTGGVLRPLQHSLVDPLGGLILAQVHADIAFIGCNGIDVEHGVTNVNLPEAAVKSRMVRAASQVIVLADASKVGRTQLGRIGALDEFTGLITDSAADHTVVEDLRTAGLPVTVVPVNDADADDEETDVLPGH
ncbi:DeoR/GlpR family DNA-binding transcription regulator [Plantibacter sp. YIM 135249]|uniref:DeoR/GlpR family DNA-binding transcription regulator n=1 Tax=Plantibacter sp. YIM 135249 TaxID=3423918 RepID=UPI003D32C62D